jgi:hypothetical protein
MPNRDPAGYLPNVKKARLKRFHGKLAPKQDSDDPSPEPHKGLRNKLRSLRGDSAKTRQITKRLKPKEERADFSNVEAGSSSTAPKRNKVDKLMHRLNNPAPGSARARAEEERLRNPAGSKLFRQIKAKRAANRGR